MDNKQIELLNHIFAWSQGIRIEAQRNYKDGIDDDALIIQEEIENYIWDLGLNPRSVINYEEHNIFGKRRYDNKF